MLRQAWEDFVARTTGPLRFRFVLQPAIVIVMAILAGRRDARAGRRPFLVAFFTNSAERPALILDLMREINAPGRVAFLFATHDPIVVARARRVVKLHDGAIASDERR